MKKPIIIGITGGIGGGKSTFSETLREKGQLVYDTDLEAKNLQDSNQEVIKQIKDLFGSNIYTNGRLNRSELAKIVFSNSDKLQALNEIVHPFIKKDILRWASEYSDKDFLFVECAILFEANFRSVVDEVIVVTATKKERIRRVMLRDNLSAKEVKDRISNQLPEKMKTKDSKWTFYTDDCNNTIDEVVSDFLFDLKKDYYSI